METEIAAILAAALCVGVTVCVVRLFVIALEKQKQ